MNFPVKSLLGRVWKRRTEAASYEVKTKQTFKLEVTSTLTAGVNFTNVLRTAFMPVDPKSVKRY